MAKVPSLAITVDFCRVGEAESLRFTCPDRVEPTAAVPLTTFDETPPDPPPQPASIRPSVIREKTVMAASDLFTIVFIISPLSTGFTELCQQMADVFAIKFCSPSQDDSRLVHVC
jgi:hypothetical protein